MTRIEDYALIGDRKTAALVSRDGRIDWLCVPRFDSGAAFAALIGTGDNGFWSLAPVEPRRVTRAYRDRTLTLETIVDAAGGRVRVVDVMPLGTTHTRVVRRVEGLDGTVAMQMCLRARFDYGSLRPAIERTADALVVVAGPSAMALRSTVEVAIEAGDLTAAFSVAAGECVTFDLVAHHSWRSLPEAIDVDRAIAESDAAWRAWVDGSDVRGPYTAALERSLLTLKALTYEPTGAIVAAPTTSLPEAIGGVRNWDYRYCWLRDAALTLKAFTATGHTEEAAAWRDWLGRAFAGDVSQTQILYGIDGDRRITELELDWLAGYEGSKPVRIGNAAYGQLQLDIYGEVIDALTAAATSGLATTQRSSNAVAGLIDLLETRWREPDNGIWEVRSEPRHFVFSKVSAWLAFDRGARFGALLGIDGHADKCAALRDAVRADVEANGWDPVRRTFVQSYGSARLDATALLLIVYGFLEPGDPRSASTIAAVEHDLMHDGLLRRYVPDPGAGSVDGVRGDEGVFLACSFWLVSARAMVGRLAEARELFERLLSLCNDVGLLSEEYDPVARRMLGNFPQAFTHEALVAAAIALAQAEGAAMPTRRSAPE
jgi:GH15 family glucan-1,4-alpha-glucosidase